MKILHVCETVKGGLSSYLNVLVPAQQKMLGTEQVCLLIPDAHKDCLKEIANINTFKRNSRKGGLLNLTFAYIKVMLNERPDIVHAHSTFAGIVVRILSPLFFRTPVVYCPHGWAMDMDQSNIRKSIVTQTERILSCLCFRIVAISKHERQTGIEAGIRAEKITTIYNGIEADPPAFDPVFWNDTQHIRTLFIGRFDRQKGIDVLLEAAATLTEQISLKLIGGAVSGDESVDLTRYPFAENLGWCEQDEIAAWLDQCDVVVVPSRWEGFGLVAIEAMRMSKALVASQVGGLAEILDDEKTGHYLKAEDIPALKTALQSLDKDACKAMGKAGRERFLKHFTSEQMITRMMDLYEETITRKTKKYTKNAQPLT